MVETVEVGRQHEAVVVFGRQVPVVEVVGASLVTHFGSEEVCALLVDAGMDEEEALKVAQKLRKAGYHIIAAWANIQRPELVSVGVGPGYLNSTIAAFQRRALEVCGSAFARVMAGSEKSDAETAVLILRAKGAPQAPSVSESSGWAPNQTERLEFLNLVQNWLAPMDAAMARTIRQIEVDPEVREEDLEVPRLNVKSMALGSVLRSPQGISIGKMTKIVAEAPLQAGCGLWILQDATKVVMAKSEEMLFKQWQHSKPVLAQGYRITQS
jgi:hypothetical protein